MCCCPWRPERLSPSSKTANPKIHYCRWTRLRCSAASAQTQTPPRSRAGMSTRARMPRLPVSLWMAGTLPWSSSGKLKWILQAAGASQEDANRERPLESDGGLSKRLMPLHPYMWPCRELWLELGIESIIIVHMFMLRESHCNAKLDPGAEAPADPLPDTATAGMPRQQMQAGRGTQGSAKQQYDSCGSPCRREKSEDRVWPR